MTTNTTTISIRATFPPDSRELVENAKSLARPAGYAMLAAFLLNTVEVIAGTAISIANELNDPAQQDVLPLFFGTLACCYVVFEIPMLIFIGIGAKSLFTLGSRALIITAIVMNFIVFLIFCCGVVSNTLLGTWAPVDFAMGTSIATSSVSSLANLTAAVMAIRVLTFREVADAYAARAEERLRRRY
jgi:hypothetical protein